ncbi:hypothetical protein Tco_0984489, partial [Tanacetum coccineum]
MAWAGHYDARADSVNHNVVGARKQSASTMAPSYQPTVPLLIRDGNKIRTRWGPDIRTSFDRGIPELTGDGDKDGESPILKRRRWGWMIDRSAFEFLVASCLAESCVRFGAVARSHFPSRSVFYSTRRGESIVGEDSIRIVNSFSKVIDEMNKSTTNHAARVDRNLRSDSDSAIRVALNPKSGVTCDGSPKVSNSSPLVSPSTTINVARELYSIDVAATFGVPLTTVGDLHKLITDIEVGKHDELLSEMTNDDRMKTLDALDDSINLNVDESTIPSDPIVQSVGINTKSTFYAGAEGASAKDQPKVNSNFRTLVADPVFDGVNISIPRKVVEK